MVTPSNKALSLRPISESDEAFLAKLYASTRQEEMAQSGWPQAEIDKFLLFQFKAQHKHYQMQYDKASYDVLLLDNVACGRLYLDKRHDEYRIIDIALLPEYRGQGLGGQLLNDILAEAASKKLPVRIHVEYNNPAMHLYQRLGFVKTDETGVYYLMEKPYREEVKT